MMKKFLLFIIISLSFYAAKAQVAYVTNTNDSGPGSLRQAILDVNTYYAPNTAIQFSIPSNSYIYITSPLPLLTGWGPPFTMTGTLSNYTVKIYASSLSAKQSIGLAVQNGSVYYNNNTYQPVTITEASISQAGVSGGSARIFFDYQNFSARSYVVTTTDVDNYLPNSINEVFISADNRQVGTIDTIKFDIPGIAPHVINLKRGLALGKTTIVDANSQPANGYAGTAPKINLANNGAGQAISLYNRGVFIENKTRIEGLCVSGFSTGIYLSAPVTVGTIGKGNFFYGNTTAISCAKKENTSYAVIENNIFGVNPYTNDASANSNAIVVTDNYSIEMMGKITINNNVIVNSSQLGILIMEVSDVVITNNKIGVLADMSVAPNATGIQVYNSTEIYIGQSGKGNVISGNTGNGIFVGVTGIAVGPHSDVFITDNFIGTDPSGMLNLGNGDVGIIKSYRADGRYKATVVNNKIANNRVGVTANEGMLLNRNSIFNNTYGIQQAFLATPTITTRTNSLIEGTSVANSTIQIFEDNDSGLPAQGKTFIAEVPSDANGLWSYSGSIDNPCQVTAICIQPSLKRSSSFSIIADGQILPDSLTYCIGNIVTLDATTNYDSYLWSDGSTSQTLAVTTPGKYWVDVFGCRNFSDTVVVAFISAPGAYLGNDTTICTADGLTLSTAIVPGASFVWKRNGFVQPGISNVHTPAFTANYSVEVSIKNCVSKDTVRVARVAPPVVKLDRDTILCNGQTITKTLNFTGATYTWSDGSRGNSLTISTSGQYWAEAKVNNSCWSRDTFIVQVTNCSIVSGTVYTDLNNNSNLDASDPLVSSYIVSATNGTLTYYNVSDANGSYSFNLPDGTYIIKPSSNSGVIITTPIAQQYTVVVDQDIANTQQYNFGITPPARDLSISVSAPFRARPGAGYTSTIVVENNGSTVLSGAFQLTPDAFLSLSSSSIAASYSGGVYSFNPGTINPKQKVLINVEWLMPMDLSLLGKHMIVFGMLTITGDQNPADNISQSATLVSYSYDPNQITVTAQYNPATQQAYDTDLLQYDIEFQNTGTDYAEDIVIIDTLPTGVDPSTVQIIGSSHNYTWDLTGQGILTFTFEDIMLLDSNANEPASHGHISYQVRHRSLPMGTEIDNEAYIYFDLNAPVLTDTAVYKITGPTNIQTIQFTAVADTIYNDTPYIVLDASASSGLDVSYACNGPVTLGHDTLYFTGTTGNVLAGAYQQGDASFNPAYPKYIRFVVSTRRQILNFGTLPDKTTNDVPFSLAATGGSSGNPIIYTVVSGPATINNNEVTLTGVPGVVIIEASQAGNQYYSAATSVTQQFNVLQVTATHNGLDATVSVWPNPCVGNLNVSIQEAGTYEVLNTQGKAMMSGACNAEFNLDLSSLPAGVYTLKIVSGEKIKTVSVVKQ